MQSSRLLSLLLVALAASACSTASNDPGADQDGDSGAGASGSSQGSGGDLELGSGGSGGASVDACTPGATQPCYPGDESVAGVGACALGTQSCVAEGEFTTWTECEGFVLPTEDTCGDGVDNDCDGVVDPGCCVPMDYSLSSGFTSNGGTVCCEDPDTIISVTDCGEGDDHWAMQSGNCGVAYEGSDNYGGPCVTIQCKDVCPN